MNNFLGQEGVTIRLQAAMWSGRWRDGKVSKGPSVEKHAEEEPSGQRFLEWVVRHLDQTCGKGLKVVDLTGGYCWSTLKCRKLCRAYVVVEGPGTRRIRSRTSDRVTWK